MADKDLSELVSQLNRSAAATQALVIAQRAATQATDRLMVSIGGLGKLASRSVGDFDAASRSLASYAAAARLVTAAHAEVARAQAPVTSALKATDSAAGASAEKLKAAQGAAKDLSGVMVDTFAAIASGETPLKVLASKSADLSKVLLRAKVDGADLGDAFVQLGGLAGDLVASVLSIAGAQAVQTLASDRLAASSGAATVGELAMATASREATAALAFQTIAAREATVANAVAAEAALATAGASTAAAGAARGLGSALLGAFGGPVGAAILAVGGAALFLFDAEQKVGQATKQQREETGLVSTALDAYREAAMKAATATGENVKSAKEEAAAQREKAVQTRNSAIAKTQEARATLAQIAADRAKALGSPDEYMGEGSAPTTAGQVRLLDLQKRRQQVAFEQAQANVKAADKGIAETDAILKAGVTTSNVATVTTRKHTEAIKADAVETVGLGDDVFEFITALEKQNAAMGMSEEAMKRLEIQTAILNAPTEELRQRAIDAGQVWELHTKFTKDAAEAQKLLQQQQNETLHTMQEVIGDGPHFSTIFEDITDALTKNMVQADATRSSIESIATALSKNDWTGSLGSTIRLVEQLEKAFGKTGTTAGKLSALAGVAQGVGGIIGGKTGSAIGGLASGALSGMSLGSVIPGIGTVAGAAIGAVIGGLGSLFGSSKAKKQAKAQAAAEEAQRQAQIAAQGYDLDIQIAEANGDTATAKKLRRQQTLNGVAPANQARQQKIFDIEDAQQREADIKAVNEALSSLGMTFQNVGGATDAARDRLIKLSGGIEALASQTAFFGEHFLTEDQRLKPVKDSVAAKLTELKLPMDLSREGFAKTVLDQDVSTEDGAKLYAALMALAPAFDKVATAAETARKAIDDQRTSIQDQIDALAKSPTELLAKSRAKEMEAVEALDASLVPLLKTLWGLQDAAEAAKLATDRSNLYTDLLDAQGRTEEAKAQRRANALAAIKDPVQQDYQQRIWAAEDAAAKVSAARDVLTEAYQREHAVLEETRDKFKALSESLHAFSASLSDTITGADLATRYRTTRQTFLTTASLARMGDDKAMGRLQAEGEAFTSASRDYASTSIDYLRDVGLVRSAVDEAADTADRQVSVAELQLDALERSVTGLIDVNGSVISVRDAIANLQGALGEARAAGVASVGGSNLGLAGNDNAPASKATLDGAFYYDSMLGQMAYTESQRDPQYYAGGVNPALTPGTQSYALLQTYRVRDKDQYDYQNYVKTVQGFATGGGFEVGGSGPPDSKLFNLALSPGEAVNVQRADQKGDRSLITELRRLREELADLRATSVRIANSNDKMERTLTNVTEGGRAMMTEAAA